jgi:hypothetical protein
MTATVKLPPDIKAGVITQCHLGRAAKKGYRHRIPPSEMAVIGAVRGAEFESVPFFRPLR